MVKCSCPLDLASTWYAVHHHDCSGAVPSLFMLLTCMPVQQRWLAVAYSCAWQPIIGSNYIQLHKVHHVCHT